MMLRFRRTRWGGAVSGLVAALALVGARRAVAAPTPAEQAMAEALFREGRELLAAGRVADACLKLEASQRLDPAPGTLVNLGLCRDKEGKTATAWADLLGAVALAERSGDRARAELARAKAADVEKRLSYLTIAAPRAPAGTEILLDGRALGSGSWDSAVPVDPGAHRVEARLAGRSAFERSVDVPAGPSTTSVEIPPPAEEQALPAPAPAVTPSPAPPAAVVSGARAAGAPAPPVRVSGRRITGWTLVGAGVLAAAAGTYFGLRTFSQQAIVEDRCPQIECNDAQGLAADAAAHRAATLSTVAFGVAVPALAVGGWLLLSGRHPAEPDVTVTAGVGSAGAALGLAGRF